MQAAPMDARASDALARQERADTADRQRLLIAEIAKCQRVDRVIPHQFETLRITHFVAHGRDRKIFAGNAVLSLFQGNDIQSRFGQLAGKDRGGPAKADRDHIDFF
jgi:hypothetical protein